MTIFTYFEPLEDGHCAFWAKSILGAAAQHPNVSKIRLVTNTTMGERLEEVSRRSNLELSILPSDTLRELRQNCLMSRGLAQWKVARESLELYGGQLFLPFMDHAVYGSILDRKPINGQVSGIIFRPPNNYGYSWSAKKSMNNGRRWLSYMAARRPALNQLFTLDEYAAESSVTQRLKSLKYVPDPAPDTSLLDKFNKVDRQDGRKVYLLFGALAKRKGIFVLLNSLRYLTPEKKSQLALKFVGKVNSEDRSEFISTLQRAKLDHPDIFIEFIDAFVTDENLAQEIKNSDVILAPYQNHVGSSGVIYWAAAANKPLISQKSGLMGYQVNKYKLGLAIDSEDPKTLAKALSVNIRGDRNEKFLAAHTYGGFSRLILNAIVGT